VEGEELDFAVIRGYICVSGLDLRAGGNAHTACDETELSANVKVGDHVGRVVGEGQVWTCRSMITGVWLGFGLYAVRGKADIVHLELLEIRK
jgi:hypothetical protein